MKPGKIAYAGWDIVPVRIPTTDGRWVASFEIEQAGRKRRSLFGDAGKPVICDDQDEAYTLACDAAMRSIDKLTAHTARSGG